MKVKELSFTSHFYFKNVILALSGNKMVYFTQHLTPDKALIISILLSACLRLRFNFEVSILRQSSKYTMLIKKTYMTPP